MSDSPVALITGCGSGIARHLTTVLWPKGYRILATDVRIDALEQSAGEQAASARGRHPALAMLARAGMNNIMREKARRQRYDQVLTPDKWLYEQELQKKHKGA